jgi:hypothetical protein
MSWSCVYFGGSRSLPSSWGGLVSQVVSAVVGAGGVGSVSVGCAAGADQQVILAALSRAQALGAAWLRGQLVVWAVGAQSGAGFWSGSAPLAVLRQAARVGQVFWSAGGGPAVPFRARLLRRSQAALAGCSCSVFFLASPSSAGSLRVAAFAAAAGQPVFAFACGFSGAPAPLAAPAPAGSWQPGSFVGFPCWVWVPAPAPAAQLSMF